MRPARPALLALALCSILVGADLRAPEEVGEVIATLWAMARARARAQGQDLLARRAGAAAPQIGSSATWGGRGAAQR